MAWVLGVAACLTASGGSSAFAATDSWVLPPRPQTEGRFWREHWYERGLTNGNPAYERRFRINSPEASLHPTFGRRAEARENGLMQIRAEEDLFLLTAAEFYAELWGGHPGTANKRIAVNGRAVHLVPRAGTEEGHCTYTYPVIPLALSELVNGYNAVQWAIDAGSSFWGHALVDEACLRVALTNGHPDLVTLGLADFSARVETRPRAGDEPGFGLELVVTRGRAESVMSVEFQGWYEGFDENGDGVETDWHGFSKNRRPMGLAGERTAAPWGVAWDASMLPAQTNVAVRARVRFGAAPGLVYVTPATLGLSVRHPPGTEVVLLRARDVPTGFWSRADRARQCRIHLAIEPGRVEKAQIMVRTWTGGAGGVKEYFTLNGRHYAVAEGSAHVVQYSVLAVEPTELRLGDNLIELRSDTEHHGIEVFLPGPVLAVRYRTERERGN